MNTWTPGDELHECPYCGSAFTVKVKDINLHADDEFWDDLLEQRECWTCGELFVDFTD